MNILLVEPDRIQADIYGEALKRAGHSVAHAPSAQTAVRAADKQMPDIVVLELQLPRHNGVEFLYEFKSYSEWAAVPVVLHTFVPAHELMRAATLEHELGVVAVLYKPRTNLGQLVEAVETAARAHA